MNKIKSILKNDFVILLLDIVAVNLAYYLALAIRVSINDMSGVFGSAVEIPEYYAALFRFAPWYTVVCILIFAMFRLYGGVWRYAGVNDLRRILGASLITCVVHIVGTLLFTRRMPITYYALGAVLQMLFITANRFARRIAAVEIRKPSKAAAPALVVGAGELGQQTVQVLHSGAEYRVDCIVDTENEHVGRLLNGIPVFHPDDLTNVLERYHVTCVFLAEPNLGDEEKAKILKLCREHKVDLRESVIGTGAREVQLEAPEMKFVSVTSVDEKWAQEYKEQFGEEPSFF